jgi:methionyl-tRNA formyltransferase
MASRPLRIGFAGTPDFAAKHLEVLLQEGFDIRVVLTQPDRPAGRGKKLMPSPTKIVAEAANIPIWQPTSLKDDGIQKNLSDQNLDVLVVVAYGMLLPQAVLDIPRYGCLNVHASLLPRWRGAAPVQRAVEAGDAKTGVCIMQMEAGLDTGPVLAVQTCPITSTTTAGALFSELETLGAKTLITTLKDLQNLQSQAEPQDHNKSTYAHKITKAEAFIDFSQPALTVDRKIRAFYPFPGAFTSANDERLRIHEATVIDEISQSKHPAGTILKASGNGIQVQCGAGILNLIQVQLPGGKALAVKDVLNSNKNPFVVGAILGRPLA